MILAVLPNFMNLSDFFYDLNYRIEAYSNKVQNFQEQINQESNAGKLQSLRTKLQYSQAQVKVFKAQKELKQQYFLYLLKMIDFKNNRPSASQAISDLKEMMKGYKENNSDSLQIVESHSAKLIFQSLPIPKTVEQQIQIAEVIERRKVNFATIYGEPHTQYLRVDRLVI